MQDPSDPLSPLGRTILKLNPDAYQTLVVRKAGIVQAKDILETTRPDALITGGAKRQEEAEAMLAGSWLWHDFLDESHRICQALETEAGSWWHAIMHRREGDFSNSKYWYARCASHPAMQTLAIGAAQIVNRMPADKGLLRLILNGWNPAAFVDLVASAHQDEADAKHALAVVLQQLEWRTLFEHNTRAAAGLV